MITPTAQRERLDAIQAELETEWSSWAEHLRDIRDYILPRTGRFLDADTKQQGRKRHHRIIDSRATNAARTAAAGLVSGLTKPSIPWFTLTTSDPAISEDTEVKAWLDTATKRVRDVFTQSNLYTSLPKLYLDALVYGTGAMTVQRNRERVLHTYVHPIGSYRLGQDDEGRASTFTSSRSMSLYEIAQRWGEESMPEPWRQRLTLENGKHRLEKRLVRQTIYPNPDFRDGALEASHKRFRQDFWVDEKQGDNKGILGTSGFDEFPVIVARWTRNGTSTYGDSPGMDVLPDVKMLQQLRVKLLTAVDKIVDPPLQAPSELEGPGISLRAGRTTFHSDDSRGQGVRPIHEVNLRIAEVLAIIEQVHQQIDTTFHVDLFRVLADGRSGPQSTAFEIEQLVAERDTQLGPVLETLSDDTLDPLVELAYAIVSEARTEGGEPLIPDPPEELVGRNVTIEYLSIIAKAQKLVAARGLRTFIGAMGELSTVLPEALDRLDADETVEELADVYGTPVQLRSVADADQIRAARAEQLAQQRAAEQAQQTAATTKDLGAADADNVTNILSRLSAATPAAG